MNPAPRLAVEPHHRLGGEGYCIDTMNDDGKGGCAGNDRNGDPDRCIGRWWVNRDVQGAIFSLHFHRFCDFNCAAEFKKRVFLSHFKSSIHAVGIHDKNP